MASMLLKRTMSFIGPLGNRSNNGVISNVNGARGIMPGGCCDVFGEDKRWLYRYPRITIYLTRLIKFVIPVGNVDPSELRMKVCGNNEFIVERETNNERSFVESLALPDSANFEKAVFETKFNDGFVYVTVTNFQKEEVVVKFDD